MSRRKGQTPKGVFYKWSNLKRGGGVKTPDPLIKIRRTITKGKLLRKKALEKMRKI